MREVVLLARARQDLKDIWRFSYAEWGEGQADAYLRELEVRIEALATLGGRGPSRDRVRAGYRSIQVRRHVVFYKIDDSKVRVIRVLHERMDEARHL